MRSALVLLLGIVAASRAGAATVEEHFSSDPVARGWRIFGDTNLFRWNATNQNLEVTWDSRQTNSYFHRPLGTVLTRSDDFSLAFDLRLSDITVGIDSNKPFTFEIAIGLLNLADATSTNFLRGTGVDPTNGPRNLVEFDYFPDSGFGATVSPAIVSSNNQFATTFNFPLELTVGDQFRIVMSYTAGSQTLVTTMTRNGAAFGPVDNVVLDQTFTDFRVEHFAISSYSDAGQHPMFGGSVLAHGVIDSISITTPPPPVANLTGHFTNGVWQVQFLSRSNWRYTLERTGEFQSWSGVSPAAAGTGATLLLQDTNPPAEKAYYRVRAERP